MSMKSDHIRRLVPVVSIEAVKSGGRPKSDDRWPACVDETEFESAAPRRFVPPGVNSPGLAREVPESQCALDRAWCPSVVEKLEPPG